MELLFVIGILVILVGISWVAGTKVLRSQTKAKTKAEIILLVGAIEQYKTRWGGYPHSWAGNTYDGELDFGEYLSKVLPDGNWKDASNNNIDRPMLIDYDKEDILVDNSDYADNNASETNVQDPYENTYWYVLENNPVKIRVYSAGLDGEYNAPDDEDNVSSDDL